MEEFRIDSFFFFTFLQGVFVVNLSDSLHLYVHLDTQHYGAGSHLQCKLKLSLLLSGMKGHGTGGLIKHV